jgi:hypothetical protein
VLTPGFFFLFELAWSNRRLRHAEALDRCVRDWLETVTCQVCLDPCFWVSCAEWLSVLYCLDRSLRSGRSVLHSRSVLSSRFMLHERIQATVETDFVFTGGSISAFWQHCDAVNSSCRPIFVTQWTRAVGRPMCRGPVRLDWFLWHGQPMLCRSMWRSEPKLSADLYDTVDPCCWPV